MNKLLPLFALLLALNAQAQVFWTEDFGAGCDQGNVADAYNGTNGAWTISATGANDDYANVWYVSASAAGTGVGNCSSNCTNGGPSNRTLHVGAVDLLGFVTPDDGASYNAGGLCDAGYCVATNTRAESPVINCSGKTNVWLSFVYFENGDGANDDGTLWYYNGSAWSLLYNLDKTPLGTCANGTGQWTAYSVALPASANNNPNVKIGFNWTNDDDGNGTDPSFAVDDIRLSTCSVDVATTPPACFGDCNGTATATVGGISPYVNGWSTGATSNALTALCAGTYEITIMDAIGCSATTTTALSQPTQLAATDSVYANSCAGCNSGMASVDVQGGTTPYTYAWSNGQTTALNVYLNPGVYSYTVTDANGCIVSGSATIEEITSYGTNVTDANATLYPNPFNDACVLTVNGLESRGNMRFDLYNALGQRVRSLAVTQRTTVIAKQMLVPGVYHAVLMDAGQNVLYRERVVVQ